ncbi:MAG: TIGR00296 family protein [Candidatus Poribacteria bacterium]|nr:MAG: TIGR00296 family protein [Candidatus Poribacteria bacterium]
MSEVSSPEFLDETAQKALLRLARETIEAFLNGRPLPRIEDYALPPEVVQRLKTERRGAFVTLKGGGALRGCIGRILDDLPLAEVVQRMAIAAATEDPRFPRVLPEELPLLEIEISVLTPPRRVKDLSEIQVGRHGLIVRRGWNSGLLLPQVPVEQGWNRDQFLAYTCLKAGLPPGAWRDPNTVIEAFEAQVFSEADFKDQA